MSKLARRSPVAKAANWILPAAALSGLWVGWLARAVQRWGASDSEAARELPGDELVPGGRRTTYAITIDAPPEQVWACSHRSGVAGPGSTPTPGSSGSSARTLKTLVMDRQPPESALSATWTLVVEPLPDGRSRLIDRHRGERSPGVAGRASDTFWTVGTLLMERGMLRGIKARAERTRPARATG